MLRFRDQAAHLSFDCGCVKRPKLRPRLALHPFGKGGAAGDGCRAAAYLIANLRDGIPLESRRTGNNTGAGGIGNVGPDRRGLELPHVARIFEMIEEGVAVQSPSPSSIMQLNIFLTGATGYIGGAIAEALLARGHRVTGLVRSDDAASKLSAKGVVPHRGDLASPASLADVTRSSDGVIHAGTTSDGRLDREAVRAMLEALGGSGKPFVYTSGVWVLGDTGGAVADESAPLKPAALVAWRPGVEAMVLESARHGVRAVVIRPAIVYGRARGIPADFVKSARETRAARLVGSG